MMSSKSYKYCITDLEISVSAQQPRPNTGSPRKSKKQPVIVHNKMTPTSTEDWILYGDEAVTAKHSSVRQRKAKTACRTSHTDRNVRNDGTTGPTMPPTPPGSSPAHSEHEKKEQRDKRSNWHTYGEPQSQPVCGHLNPGEVGDPRAAWRGTSSHRLPTPDLSDVDEDEMWACCSGADVRR